FRDEAVTYWSGCRLEGSTLHRPPPLMRILRPPFGVLSSSSTRAPPEPAKIEAINPAAPAPITATSNVSSSCMFTPDRTVGKGGWSVVARASPVGESGGTGDASVRARHVSTTRLDGGSLRG